ncbi:MAG: hypothetical protein L3J26_11300 [Candidatus Polarisedimenticolaceae bacterium]|nr:hypothetical protein [Candidatus Polarisedimenticolaceae bacterium]
MTIQTIHPFTALILLLAALQSHAGSLAYQQGREAADRGDHNQAYTIFLPAAQQGDTWSQFALGVLYLNGDGTAADSARSTRWFQKAANQGLSFAQFNLGNAYLHGRGVEPDLTKAAFWWQQAAEQGNADAQGNLGTLMYFDYATQSSKRVGRAWLTIAANNGNEAADKRLTQIRDADGEDNSSIWQSDPELSEATILTMPYENFSINLFAAKQQQSIENFLGKHNLKGKVYIYRFPRDDSFLYGILYGSYPSKETAKETIRNMHPELGKHGPWPVAFGAIQNSVRTIQTRQLKQVATLNH